MLGGGEVVRSVVAYARLPASSAAVGSSIARQRPIQRQARSALSRRQCANPCAFGMPPLAYLTWFGDTYEAHYLPAEQFHVENQKESENRSVSNHG